jgi:hypothetical protein
MKIRLLRLESMINKEFNLKHPSNIQATFKGDGYGY